MKYERYSPVFVCLFDYICYCCCVFIDRERAHKRQDDVTELFLKVDFYIDILGGIVFSSFVKIFVIHQAWLVF